MRFARVIFVFVTVCVLLLAFAALAAASEPLSGSSTSTSGTARTSASPLARAVTGPVRIAVFVVRPRGAPIRTTMAQVRSTVFSTTSNSVRTQYVRMSGGRMSLTGSVFGPWTAGTATTSCAYCVKNYVIKTAAAKGLDLRAYSKVVIFVDDGRDWGLSVLGGKWAWVWSCACNGYVIPVRVKHRWGFVHELGHTFGLHHARTNACTDGFGTPQVFGTCTLSEYGDKYDAMGWGIGANYSTTNKRFLGWIPSSRVAVANSDSTWTITSGSNMTIGHKFLRVPLRNPATGVLLRYLDIETRQHTGYDSDVFGEASGMYPDLVTAGVLVRTSTTRSTGGTTLLDGVPGTPNWRDRTLPVGSTLTDPVSGVSVTVNSELNGTAQVTVDYP